jgi:hypothetical protein
MLPTVTGEEGLAVLRIAHQLRASAYEHTTEKPVAPETSGVR